MEAIELYSFATAQLPHLAGNVLTSFMTVVRSSSDVCIHVYRIEGNWNDLGACLYVVGRYADAAEAYGRGVELMPTFGDLHGNLAMVLERLQRYFGTCCFV